MPAMMVAPVVAMAPGAIAANAARTNIGHHDAAAGVRIIGIIVVRVIVVVVASGEEAPEVVPVAAMSKSAVADAATVEHRAGAEPAAVKGRGATVEAASAKAVSTAVPAAAAMSATMSATADFDRQSVGGGVGCGRSTRTDQRQRLRALAGGGRQGQ